MGDAMLGPYLRRQDWERVGRKIEIPKDAREAIVRIGLNGATGKMWVDNVKLTFVPRAP